MKVLLINGSPRENGNTFRALSEVAVERLSGAGTARVDKFYPITVCLFAEFFVFLQKISAP
jgi:hypothetical protein